MATTDNSKRKRKANVFLNSDDDDGGHISVGYVAASIAPNHGRKRASCHAASTATVYSEDGGHSSAAGAVAVSTPLNERKRSCYVADLISKVTSPSTSVSPTTMSPWPIKRETSPSKPTKQVTASVNILVVDGSGESIGIAITNAYPWKETFKALSNVGTSGQTIGECKFTRDLPLSIFYRGINNGIFLEQFGEELANAWYLCNPAAVFDGHEDAFPKYKDLAEKIAHGITTTTGGKYHPQYKNCLSNILTIIGMMRCQLSLPTWEW